jgi:hypothetical protein
MRIHFGDAIRLGDIVYGSSGDFGPAFFVAMDVATGKVLWQDRSLARATFLAADGKLVLLDEKGVLALATPGTDGLKVLAPGPGAERALVDRPHPRGQAALPPQSDDDQGPRPRLRPCVRREAFKALERDRRSCLTVTREGSSVSLVITGERGK